MKPSLHGLAMTVPMVRYDMPPGQYDGVVPRAAEMVKDARK